MLYIALLHCSRTMLDLIFVQVEITGFSWSRCLSVGGTIGANQARHLGKNTWQVLTNAIQMQWLVPHHATFSDLTFICPSSREQIYTNHEVRQITRELHQDRLNDVARWTVERSFFLSSTAFCMWIQMFHVASHVVHDVSFVGWLSFQIGRLKKLAVFSEDLADDSFFRVDGKDKSWPSTQGGIRSWLMTVTFVDTLLQWNLNDVIYPSW